jgi:hypothetical protein
MEEGRVVVRRRKVRGLAEAATVGLSVNASEATMSVPHNSVFKHDNLIDPNTKSSHRFSAFCSIIIPIITRPMLVNSIAKDALIASA